MGLDAGRLSLRGSPHPPGCTGHSPLDLPSSRPGPPSYSTPLQPSELSGPPGPPFQTRERKGSRARPHFRAVYFRRAGGRRLGKGHRGPGADGLHPAASLLLQPARPTLQVQLRAVQAVGRPERGCLRALPPPHCRAALPLLPAGVLEGPQPAYHQPQGLQGLPVPSYWGDRWYLQSDQWAVLLQDRGHRPDMQPLWSRLPAEPLPQDALPANSRGNNHAGYDPSGLQRW